jgi:hypothetical protein
MAKRVGVVIFSSFSFLLQHDNTGDNLGYFVPLYINVIEAGSRKAVIR